MIGFKDYLLNENKEEVNGWLSSNGKLYTCNSIFCHSPLVMKTPELLKHVSEDSIKLANDTGGVEYIYSDMWRAGFLRISSNSSTMYFEGTKQSIKNLYQKAKDIAESYGRKEVFNITN